MQIPLIHRHRQRLSDQEIETLYAMLVSYALRRTNSYDEALDMVQESLTTTLEHDTAGGVEHFKAYCFQVLKSKLSLRNTHPTLPLDEADLDSVAPSPGFDFLIDEALTRLPAQEQEVVRAHDIEAEEVDDIARRMHLSESYVTKLLSQGHTRLKNLLKKG